MWVVRVQRTSYPLQLHILSTDTKCCHQSLFVAPIQAYLTLYLNAQSVNMYALQRI